MKSIPFALISLLLLFGLTFTGCKKRGGAGDGGFDPNGGFVIPSDSGYEDTIGLDGPLDGGAIGRVDTEDVIFLDEVNSSYQPVYFGYDSFVLSAAEQVKVEAAADYLRQDPVAGLFVEGHTDERGESDYNQGLGERRSIAVRDFLMAMGIEGHRVQTRSYGEELPADPGHNESAWSANRRAEFKFYHPRR